MINRLAPIITQKQCEVAILRKQLHDHPDHVIHKILQGKMTHSTPANFKRALCGSSLAVIAEIKRKSPSNGTLATISDPAILAHTYVSGGANAISVLTEEVFFNGKLADLVSVAEALRSYSIPILRKDFIIDEIQIAESIASGANAILCIVAALGKKTRTIIDCANRLGIEVLVEIIDHDELKIAIDAGAEIIGVNNRNLKTFAVDPERAMKLYSDIPSNIVKVAASGITNPQQARKYYQTGFDAVLIGEALVKSVDPAQFIMECRHG